MRHAVLLAVVLVLLVPAAYPAASQSATQTAFDSTVTIDVHVRASGDARLNVSTAYRLDSPADREAFDRVAGEFADGRVGFRAEDFREVATEVGERTGRTMEITDVERTTSVREETRNGTETGNATGVLSLTFTWTNFAAVSGNHIFVDDVFASGWLSHLEPDMRLRFHSPPGYGAQDAPVAPENGTLAWTGPHTFEDGGPEVVYEGGLGGSTTPSTASTTDPGPSGFDGQFQLMLAAVAVLLVGGFLAYVWTRRDEGLPVDTMVDDGEPTTPGADGPDPADGERTADDAPGDDGAAAAADDASADDEPDVDEELLSDEERVERMLRAEGGRMKQADIVTETGWSNAKVSQLLSSMHEEGRVEKLRLGRENLIILDDGTGGDEGEPF